MTHSTPKPFAETQEKATAQDTKQLDQTTDYTQSKTIGHLEEPTSGTQRTNIEGVTPSSEKSGGMIGEG